MQATSLSKGEKPLVFAVTHLESRPLLLLPALPLARNADLEKAPFCVVDCARGFARRGTQGELIILVGTGVAQLGAGRIAIVWRSQDVL